MINSWIDNRLSKKMVNRLLSLPFEDWLEVGHLLNCWKFPMQFYDLMPKWYLKTIGYNGRLERAFKIIKPVLKIINSKFNEEDQLMYHNVIKGRMTKNEFYFWYKNVVRGNIEVNYYRKLIQVQKIEWWKDDVFLKLSQVGVFDDVVIEA